MLTTPIAALLLASSLTLEVPFLPQSDALCGGAAVAMVFRYWGDAHADVQQFAALVDRRGRGIADGVLVDAVERRGWRAVRVNGSIDELRSRLGDRQPVIVLVADRHDTYHYVVVVGTTADRVIVHDPSWGPSRAITEQEFVRIWKPTNFWSLVILPGTNRVDAMAPSSVAPPPSTLVLSLSKDERSGQASMAATSHDARCEALLERALSDSSHRDLRETEAVLNDVRAECPASAGPLRELAGVRFAQRRWSDAADFARQALRFEPHDEYAWDLLGSSLFMQDDAVSALQAWNRIGKPRVNSVEIEGIRRARYQAIADAIAIRPNTLLTAGAFERARRRLDELPDRAAARLAFRPEAEGFATVDVVVTERPARPRGVTEWTAAAARAAIDREVAVGVPGVTGQGELWSASWRWWNDRPRVAVGFATPRTGALPGVWRVDASWETQTYAFDTETNAVRTSRESRAHGGLTVSDWLTGTLRYAVGAGVDAWDGSRKTAFLSASIERRLLNNRASLSANATNWMSITGVTRDRAFASLGARARFRSSPQFQGWVYDGAVGSERVSDDAPLALWPGAGDGRARAVLLRAHPLLDDGIVDTRGTSAFGRSLTYANGEVQRWLDRPLIPRIGFAGFADVAHAARGAAFSSRVNVDVGGGLRIRIPGADGVLRIDAAHGIRDGANALTFGWLF